MHEKCGVCENGKGLQEDMGRAPASDQQQVSVLGLLMGQRWSFPFLFSASLLFYSLLPFPTLSLLAAS